MHLMKETLEKIETSIEPSPTFKRSDIQFVVRIFFHSNCHFVACIVIMFYTDELRSFYMCRTEQVWEAGIVSEFNLLLKSFIFMVL